MDLSAPVDKIKGIGPKAKETLTKSGIVNLRDLLYYLPRTYDNYHASTKLSELRPGKVVVRGKISELRILRTSRRNLTITEGIIHDSTDAIKVVWFNQPYRAKQFDEKREYYFTGEYSLSRGRYQLTSPSAKLVEEVQQQGDGGMHPVYSIKAGFKAQQFAKIFNNLRPDFTFVPDLLPESEFAPDFVKTGARGDALFRVHFPENLTDVEEGRKYLAYEELFELILAANLNKLENQKLKAPSIKFDQQKIQDFVQQLPFELTGDQRRASWEILQDLEKTTPMNRLLQGDVGSGKTVVAAIAALQAALGGFQCALLAPTAVLANQHAESLDKLLSPFGVRVGLLTGATKRKDILKKHIKAGDIDLIIGTHAIITDDTEFNNLALCIIDEQHRFGVNQRQKLLTKTVNTEIAPHLLTMTATPIPRSLQLAIFGDLDVSILKQMPKGRQPVKTKVLNEINLKDDLYPAVREMLGKKQQVYWICRTIEENASSETKSVKKQTEKLKEIFPDARITFLHGRMKAPEKDQIMSDFAAGNIDILVSTTVVEVGVNVPNANLMIIMDAEGYGLAQLHQLRGRVGRGTEESFCYLVVSGDNAPTKRLRELEKSTDGFHLAEVDLKIRGPGEIYGNLQHGALDLQFATLTDTELIAAASKQAKEFAKHPEDMVKYPELSACIKKYQQLTTLN